MRIKKRSVIISAIIAAAVIAIIAIVIFASGREAGSPERLLSLGEKYLLEMEYEQAIVQFLKVIEIDPKNIRAYLGAAEAYIALGRDDEAIVILRKGLEQTNSAMIQAMLDGVLTRTAPTPMPQTTPESTPKPASRHESEPTPEPVSESTPEPTPQSTPELTPEPTPLPTPESTSEPTPLPTPESTSEPTPLPTPEPTPEPTPQPTPASVVSSSGGNLTRGMLIGEWRNMDTGDIYTFASNEVLPEGATQADIPETSQDVYIYYIVWNNAVDMFAEGGGHLKDYGFDYDPGTQILTGIDRDGTFRLTKIN